MDIQDPWEWSVDRVVQELCTENRSWNHSLGRMPDPAILEAALREQEITGDLLLVEMTEEFIRGDLGLKSLPARAYIKNAITHLRLVSLKYRLWWQKYDPVNTISHLSRSVRETSHQHSPRTVLTRGLEHQQEQHDPSSLGSPGFNTPNSLAELNPSHHVSLVAAPPTPEDHHTPELMDEDLQGPTNPMIANEPKQHDQLSLGFSNERRELSTFDTAQTPNIVPEEVPLTTTEKKRKRIAPTLVSPFTNPDLDRSIPSYSDDFGLNLSLARTEEPGTVFRDENGQKRMVPVVDKESAVWYARMNEARKLQNEVGITSAGAAAGAAAEQILRAADHDQAKHLEEALAWGYLGKKKMPVDDIFYSGTEVGQELSGAIDTGEIRLLPNNFSGGRKLYVHGIMRHFLRAQYSSIERDGKLFSASLPYSPSLVPNHQTSSFTLYSTSPDKGIHATRELISCWPEINPESSSTDKAALISQALQLGGSYEDQDFSYLEKWNLIDGDELLPVYGESDEENEYDPENWTEMEAEGGKKLYRPKKQLTRRPISQEEIGSAIDEGIAELVVNWNEKKLPKLKLKAWKIWNKFRIHNKKNGRIQELQRRVDATKKRLLVMRREITNEIWTSKLQVRKQTRIMEQSVSDREEDAWEISVLSSEIMPLKPPHDRRIRRAVRPVDIEEEGESLDSSESPSSDDDGLDDFIDDADTNDDERGESDGASISDDSIYPLRNEIGFHTHRMNDNSNMLDTSDSDCKQGIKLPVRLDSPPTLKAKRSSLQVSSSSRAEKEIIDLTFSSSEVSSSSQATRESVNLITPEKPRAAIKLGPRMNVKLNLTSSERSLIAISDTDDVGSKSLDLNNLPSLVDVSAIGQHGLNTWTRLRDRDRLLIAFLYKEVKTDMRVRLFNFLTNISEEKLWSRIIDAAQALTVEDVKAKGVDSKSLDVLRLLVQMLLIYINCRIVPAIKILRNHQVDDIEGSKAEQYPDFYQRCRKLQKHFSFNGARNKRLPVHSIVTSSDIEEEPSATARRRSRLVSTSEDEIELESPRKKKVKKFHEDANARDLRAQDRERQVEQEERRRLLLARLEENSSGVERDRIIINEGKFDNQGYVYINEHIGKKIKTHQIAGLRFMWSQIVTTDDVQQGCLLAHMMGLGKTMQAITLLVAIAEAASSPDPSIRSQVPERLRDSKTLVLCPPGLLDNWMDEFLIWTPKGLLGELRKVSSSIKIVNQRIGIIDDWYHDGGVLIMGYEMFRSFINNKSGKSGKATLEESQHEKVKKQLLEGPNLVIADEAHKMKNSNSQLTAATMQFKSKNRLALTGSPLANNVEEYHTMIEWVAPNYLGPISEFRQKYVQPIQDGLYFDSTHSERRKGLKMLDVLQQDLNPKVNRADVSVLRADLLPKIEFAIIMPLTKLQKDAYTIYVKAMMLQTDNITQTTLWHWLAVLVLLCNHPSCFRTKLSERKEAAASKSKTIVLATDDGRALEEEVSIWKAGVSENLVSQELALLGQETDLTSNELSNKVKILIQILDAAKAANDKVLVFTNSIPTLDFLEDLCRRSGRDYGRLDGKTSMARRQDLTKEFNTGSQEVYLISTTAGGLGLNLPSANRVVIFDFKFNPTAEEQAVGRAYRIGQTKPVFVYRFVVGGTFEEVVHNTAIFKMQLAARVVDKKNPVAWAKKNAGEYLFEPKEVEEKDLSSFHGLDPLVLDKILAKEGQNRAICNILKHDTFERIEDEYLTAEDRKEIKQLLSDEQLKRSNPDAYYANIRLQDLNRNREYLFQQQYPNSQTTYLTNPQQLPRRQQAYSSIPNTLSHPRQGSPPINELAQSSRSSQVEKQQASIVVANTSKPSYGSAGRSLEPIAGAGTEVQDEGPPIRTAPPQRPSSPKQIQHNVPVGESDFQRGLLSSQATNSKLFPNILGSTKTIGGSAKASQVASSKPSRKLSPEVRLVSAFQRASRTMRNTDVLLKVDTAVQKISQSIARSHVGNKALLDKLLLAATCAIDNDQDLGVSVLTQKTSVSTFVADIITKAKEHDPSQFDNTMQAKATTNSAMFRAMDRRPDTSSSKAHSPHRIGIRNQQDEDAQAQALVIKRRKESRRNGQDERNRPNGRNGNEPRLPGWVRHDIERANSRDSQSRRTTSYPGK